MASKKLSGFNVLIGQFKTDLAKLGIALDWDYLTEEAQLADFMSFMKEDELVLRAPLGYNEYPALRTLTPPPGNEDAFWKFIDELYIAGLNKKNKNRYRQRILELAPKVLDAEEQLERVAEVAGPILNRMMKVITEKDAERLRIVLQDTNLTHLSPGAIQDLLTKLMNSPKVQEMMKKFKLS